MFAVSPPPAPPSPTTDDPTALYRSQQTEPHRDPTRPVLGQAQPSYQELVGRFGVEVANQAMAARGEAVPTADRPARGNLWAGVTPNRGAR
jgi:hypothetical protein